MIVIYNSMKLTNYNLGIHHKLAIVNSLNWNAIKLFVFQWVGRSETAMPHLNYTTILYRKPEIYIADAERSAEAIDLFMDRFME